MAEGNQQNFANHARFDPAFHFFILPVAMINVVNQIVVLFRHATLGTVWSLVLAIAFVVAAFKIRLYALKVQDRVIRLEERLRLAQVLPETLRQRAKELSERQLIALRFASDAELPALVEKALAQNMKPKDIKQAVAVWRPDFFRV